ncbi:MAG: efflux RND transporter periplasmic adaptor subunit [Deltaproteobacteria bacterium]|nr:efflux RND transporter periplasmic adaptor subunit [Deltaproteobacteria bacterium]
MAFFNELYSFLMQHKKETTVALSCLVILLALAIVAHIIQKNIKSKPVIYVEVTQPVQKEMMESISATGTIAAEKQTTLASKIPGKIKSILIQEGQEVGANQKLIQLESKELELQTEIAESAHRSAASAIDEENYKRHKALYEEGVITKSEFDKIEAEYKAAKADKDRLEKTVQLQEEQKASSEITAPFTALTAQILVHEGEVIAAGQPLAELVSMDTVNVEVPIASQNIEKIQKGMEAHVTVDSSSETFRGTLETISPVADPMSRTFDTKIKIDNKNRILKPGMFAKVSLIVQRRPKALTLPKTALIKKEDLPGKWIYTIKNKKAHLQQIQTGLESKENVEVTSPLDLTETVVTAGQSELYEGASVSIVSPSHVTH